ncbi:MAG: hypothetical protein ACI8PP_001982 [Candidatus Pseudothioglobus sp.]|jgi:hypothetical protein
MSDRAMYIAIILSLGLLVGYIVYERFFRPEVVVVAEPVDESPVLDTRTAARATLSSCKRVQNRTQLAGYVENTGNTDLSFVTVTALWKDKNALVIETAVIYVVKDVILKPGERREFEASAEKSRAARCNVELLDWWT